MPVSKVIYGANTLIDLTADTVTAEHIEVGYTAHKADGELITGTLNTAAIEPYVYDLNCGWVGPGNGVWTYENPTNTYVDMYEVTTIPHEGSTRKHVEVCRPKPQQCGMEKI